MIFYSFLSKPYPYAGKEDASVYGVVAFLALGESYHHWIVNLDNPPIGGFFSVK